MSLCVKQELKPKFLVLRMSKTTGSLGISFLDHCHLQRALGIVLFGRTCRCAVLAQSIYILSVWNYYLLFGLHFQ